MRVIWINPETGKISVTGLSGEANSLLEVKRCLGCSTCTKGARTKEFPRQTQSGENEGATIDEVTAEYMCATICNTLDLQAACLCRMSFLA